MIVWLASYPRSGNTFLRILLQRYFGLPTLSKYDDTHDIAANPALAEITGHDQLQGNWADVYPQLDRSPDLHIVKTHDAPTDENKAIYILRDPRAVVVSYRRYLENFAHRTVDHLDVITGSVGFGSWASHLESWDPLNRPNTLFLKFEDVCTNPVAAVIDIASFLKIDPEQAEDVDFSDLQEIAPDFFRAGSNERNIDELDIGSAELINALYGEQMK
ncbi:MAG: sulfotransferase domain-containing protein, partial [Pseudomonadota bacterium]